MTKEQKMKVERILTWRNRCIVEAKIGTPEYERALDRHVGAAIALSEVFGYDIIDQMDEETYRAALDMKNS